jgi:regulatory protein
MDDRSDRNGRAEGLAPVHYLFGAGPSGAAPTPGSEAPQQVAEDGTRWFDPSVDGDEGFLDGAAQRPTQGAAERGPVRGSWASQAGERGVRALRPVGEPADEHYGLGAAHPLAGSGHEGDVRDRDPGDDPDAVRGERDEERRRQRDERAEERKARRAENVAMHALTRRGQSVQEIRDLLTARELDADEVEAEIERLSGVGLLDDGDLAENLVRTLTERKKLGRSALLSELRRRKIDPLAIEEAVAELDRDDEDERCLELARQRARQLNSLDDQTAERRLSAFLQRKGYSGDAIRKSVRTALRDERGVRFV